MKISRVFVFLTLISLAFVSYSYAYTPIHADFKGKFAPGSIPGGILSTVTSSVPATFKAFVPPGAKKVTMIIYGPQRKVYGATARVDNPPQCSYGTMAEQQAESLPWKRPNSCNLGKMRKEDCQMNAVDGQIEVLAWGMAPLTGNGHWIYVKILNYARTQLARVNYTVNVDTSAYAAWYNSVSWAGNQPPNVAAGPTGGPCDPKWKGEGGSVSGGSGSGGSGSSGGCPNASEKFTCAFSGGQWKGTPDCKCVRPGPGPEPKPEPATELEIALNPAANPDSSPFVINKRKLASTIETVKVRGDFDIILLWSDNNQREFSGKVLELLREGKYSIVAGKGGKFSGVKFEE